MVSVRDRIVEVLKKYNHSLEEAPLFALTIAMERLIEARSGTILSQLKALERQIQPPNEVGDNCTAELAVKCANLEIKVKELKTHCERLSRAIVQLLDFSG